MNAMDLVNTQERELSFLDIIKLRLRTLVHCSKYTNITITKYIYRTIDQSVIKLLIASSLNSPIEMATGEMFG